MRKSVWKIEKKCENTIFAQKRHVCTERKWFSNIWIHLRSKVWFIEIKFTLFTPSHTHPNVHPMQLYLNKHPKRLPTKHPNLFWSSWTHNRPHIWSLPTYPSIINLYAFYNPAPWTWTSINLRISSSLYINNITRSWHLKMSSNSEVHKLDWNFVWLMNKSFEILPLLL